MAADAPVLFDVNLQTCPDAWMIGEWQVRRRGPRPASLYAQAQGLHLLEAGQLQVHGPAAAAQHGHWAVERDPLLQRPYLTFRMHGAQMRGLVTRLRRASDGRAAVLTLYLQDGTELELGY